jgi:hypothetical protein
MRAFACESEIDESSTASESDNLPVLSRKPRADAETNTSIQCRVIDCALTGCTPA